MSCRSLVRDVRKFRSLVASEPALRGEYLKATDTAEVALAEAIAARTGAAEGELRPQVLAAIVIGAERAAVRHWFRLDEELEPLAPVVHPALATALSGLER
jgi:hypothetical protein